MTDGPKVLSWDIETAPNAAQVWGIWKQNIGVKQIISDWWVLCWAAKWLGSDEIMSDAGINYKTAFKRDMEDDSRTCASIWNLLDEADWVVTHHGNRFDIPKMNSRFLFHGMDPPSPFRSIDTCQIAKQIFGFTSNKLEYIADHLGVGKKIDTGGFGLWARCLQRDPQAWDDMVTYCRRDVELLERVYLKMRPWSKSHPNWGLYVENADDPMCPKCGGAVNRKGFEYTTVGRYQRYKCKACGAPSRGRSTNLDIDTKRRIITNVGG